MLKTETLDALYLYQREGVEWLRRRRSGILADEPGLGKSLQVLVDFANVRQHRPDARTLLVAPNLVIYKWAEREVSKWTNFSVEVASGTAKQRTAAIEANADITIIAYDNLDREKDLLNTRGFYNLIFDESHYIKNPGTDKKPVKRTRAAFALRGARRILLTGSPLLNRVGELWPQLFMVDPVQFPDYWRFINRYAVFGGYKGKQIIGTQNVRELRERMAPLMLRRLAKDLGDQIPPRINIPIYVDLHPEQRKVYEQARKELKIEFEGEVTHEFDNPLTKFMRLRQISNTLASVGGPDISAKLDRAVDLVDEIGSDHKIVIFSGDIATLHAMRERLEKCGIRAPILAGTVDGKTTNARTRQPIIDAFQDNREPRVLLASHGVAREGIDLYAAHYAILLDKMWVPQLQEQEFRRLQRTGQTADKVIIYEIFSKKTVEARVEKILYAKEQTFEALIEQNDLKELLVRNAKELLDD